MTNSIAIKPGRIIAHGWEFHVSFAGQDHLVTVQFDYWNKLTNGGISPIEFVRLAVGLTRSNNIVDSLPGEFELPYLASRVSNFERQLRTEAKVTAVASPR